MTSDDWVRVGLDADGEVHVTKDVDADGMRTVRFGNGRERRYNPNAVHLDWPDSLTHWDLTLYPVVFRRTVPTWRSLGRTTSGGEVWTAPIGTPPPSTRPE